MRITCGGCDKITKVMRDHSCHIELFTEEMSIINNEEDFTNYIKRHISIIDQYKCDDCKIINKNIEKAEVLKMLRDVIVILFNKYHKKN